MARLRTPVVPASMAITTATNVSDQILGPAENAGHVAQFHPPLIARTLAGLVGQTVGIVEVRELDAPVAHADERGPRLLRVDLCAQVFETARRQARGEDAIVRRGIAALLEVAEDRLAHGEQVATLLGEQRAHEAGGVHRAG